MNKFIIIFLIFLPFACTEQQKIIPDTGRRITINGLIGTDSLLNVQIGRSAYINDLTGISHSLIEDLDSAEVKIFEHNKDIDSLFHVPPFYLYNMRSVFNTGNYRSKNIFPEPGKIYEIQVTVNHLPIARGTISIPALVEILKVDTARITLEPGTYYNSNEGFICNIEFTDPSEESNYYILDIREKITRNRILNNNNLEFSCSDPIIEERLNGGEGNVGIAFSDKLIDGQKHILPVIIKRESIGVVTSGLSQTVCFRLYSITEDFFRYIHDLNIYSKNFGSPFFEPVMMYSNILNGYGMIAGAAISSDSIVFPLLFPTY